MKRRTILTPYFLDQGLPGLETLAEPDWIINQMVLPRADLLTRISGLHTALAVQVEFLIVPRSYSAAR